MIKKLFSHKTPTLIELILNKRKKPDRDPFFGHWGFVDTETGEGKVCGEMYLNDEGRPVAGPKIYELDEAPTHLYDDN